MSSLQQHNHLQLCLAIRNFICNPTNRQTKLESAHWRWHRPLQQRFSRPWIFVCCYTYLQFPIQVFF